jgi:hypothetical protein
MGRRFIPVVIGVGDIKNKSIKIEDAHEPVHLMLQSIAEAIKDTNLSLPAREELQSKIDSIHVVNTWSWAYPDLPGLLGEKLDVHPSYKVLSHHGGDSPAKLFDEAARRISFGQAKVAVVTGGESLASRELPNRSGWKCCTDLLYSCCMCSCRKTASSWVD